MLLRFIASNFLSIADEIDFNMFPASKLKTHKNHVYKTPQVDVLKAAAIYGANGSGKSNLILAMDYLQNVVVDGNIFDYGEAYFKLDTISKNKPTRLEVEFKIGNKYFAYGIVIKNYEILEEWLFELNNITKNKSTAIFERLYEKDKIILKMHEDYLQTEKDKLRIELYAEEMLQGFEPFIFFVHKKGFEIIDVVYQWFQDYLKIIMPDTRFQLLEESQTDKDLIPFINENFSKLDTGVNGIMEKKMPLKEYVGKDDYEEVKRAVLKEMKFEETDNVRYEDDENVLISKDNDENLWVHILNTKHLDDNNNEILFDIDLESDGTQRLLDLIPFFNSIQQQEITIIIDEIGRSIHPSILKKLIELTMQSNTKGQIIFTTHESQLLNLDIFRSDEIWFTEKDKFGKTGIYPLSDYKPRYDLDIQKGYLAGRFGAIPFLGDLKQLKLEKSHAEEK